MQGDCLEKRGNKRNSTNPQDYYSPSRATWTGPTVGLEKDYLRFLMYLKVIGRIEVS